MTTKVFGCMCISIVEDARPIEILKLLQKKSFITHWETWNGNGNGEGGITDYHTLCRTHL